MKAIAAENDQIVIFEIKNIRINIFLFLITDAPRNDITQMVMLGFFLGNNSGADLLTNKTVIRGNLINVSTSN